MSASLIHQRTGAAPRDQTHTADISSAPFLAASIFLDILNVFLFFVQIFSGGDKE
jgi:hypothetical protein